MQAVGQKNTGPEIAVRKALHAQGYRFRLHDKNLPGRPDLVFPGRHKVILVHGCFWHGHGCAKGRLPKSRSDYWVPKIQANKDRDEWVVGELKKAGWQSLVVWQCETKDIDRTVDRIVKFLGPGARSSQRAVKPPRSNGID